MTTFTPPTHTEYFAPPGWDRLWSRVPYQRGNTVLVNLITGTVTAYPGLQVVDSDALIAAEANGYAFLGSTTTTFDDPDTEMLLVGGGGYDDPALIQDEEWPAWLL